MHTYTPCTHYKYMYMHTGCYIVHMHTDTHYTVHMYHVYTQLLYSVHSWLSMVNIQALHNTQLLAAYASIDKRVQVLGYVLKEFAKVIISVFHC